MAGGCELKDTPSREPTSNLELAQKVVPDEIDLKSLRQKADLVFATLKAAAKNGRPSKSVILLLLAARNGRIDLHELYRECFVTDAVTRAQLRDLEKQKFVEVNRNPNDGRSFYVTLTELGLLNVHRLLNGS
jgi:DNA-binding MarR family transcriptional regulator